MISIIEAIENKQPADKKWRDRFQKWGTIAAGLTAAGIGGYMAHNKLKQNAANYKTDLASAQTAASTAKGEMSTTDPNDIYKNKFVQSSEAHRGGKINDATFIKQKQAFTNQQKLVDTNMAAQNKLTNLQQNKPFYTRVGDRWRGLKNRFEPKGETPVT